MSQMVLLLLWKQSMLWIWPAKHANLIYESKNLNYYKVLKYNLYYIYPLQVKNFWV
jgi:hypothetical protein